MSTDNTNFLFFFKPKIDKRKAFFEVSLKHGIQLLSLLTIVVLTGFTALELIITENDLFTIIKGGILNLSNLIGAIMLLASTFHLKLAMAVVGNYILSASFILQTLVIFVNACMLSFGYKMYNYSSSLSLIFFTLLSAYEIYYLWIIYGYISQLKKGNDALVDGFNFNRYVENFDNSFNSSVHSMRRPV
jgi:hypothetical protein